MSVLNFDCVKYFLISDISSVHDVGLNDMMNGRLTIKVHEMH